MSAKQLEADGIGQETEAPLHAWFDVAVYAHAGPPPESEAPLYLKKHRLKSGANSIIVRVPQEPDYATMDPYRKMPDRVPENNGMVWWIAESRRLEKLTTSALYQLVENFFSTSW